MGCGTHHREFRPWVERACAPARDPGSPRAGTSAASRRSRSSPGALSKARLTIGKGIHCPRREGGIGAPLASEFTVSKQ